MALARHPQQSHHWHGPKIDDHLRCCRTWEVQFTVNKVLEWGHLARGMSV